MSTKTEKAIGYGCAITAVSAIVGGIAGIYVGESLNDYVDALKESPKAVQYGIDVIIGMWGFSFAGCSAGLINTIVVGGVASSEKSDLIKKINKNFRED